MKEAFTPETLNPTESAPNSKIDEAIETEMKKYKNEADFLTALQERPNFLYKYMRDKAGEGNITDAEEIKELDALIEKKLKERFPELNKGKDSEQHEMAA